MYRVSHFVETFAWCLLAGAGIATLWVNLSPDTYFDFNEVRLFDLALPGDGLDGPRTFTLISLTGEMLMAFFLMFVGKELWEALYLERGSMRRPGAMASVFASFGGMAGAALAYLALAALFESAIEATPGIGWPVPLASDVVIAYVVGRAVFGAGHPALRILLLMAIANDIIGLIVLGLAAPTSGIAPEWLLLPVAASALAFFLFNWLPRRLDRGNQLRPNSTMVRRHFSVSPYLIAGAVSWVGVAASGLPPALGLLPIIPAIPHADRAFGVFAEAEELLTDTLNRLEHLLIWPVAAILFLFGLTHGGLELAAFAPTTVIVLGALLLGKPLGIMLGCLAGARLAGMALPKGVGLGELAMIGLIGGIGFTVPLLALAPGLPGGAMQEAARLGLGLSLLAAPLAWLLGKTRPGPRKTR